MMIRKPIDRNPSVCTRYHDRYARLSLPGFCGQACLHTMLSVTKPLVKTKPIPRPNRFTIADAGYAWLTLLPDAGGYAVTGILNEKGEVYQVYVDLTLDQGEDWFLDAYVDVILFDDRRVFIDDLDELCQAVRAGEVSQAQADCLRLRAQGLKCDMQQDPERWFSLIERAAAAITKTDSPCTGG